MDKDYYKNYFILEKEHWFFRVRRNIFLYFIKKNVQSDSRIFDFGCGSGYLVGELQRRGFNAWGMDFEKEAIDYGINSGVNNLALGTGDKINHPDASFDLVTAFDVLEHIDNEKPVVDELARILKPGGKMIITVPAYMWLWGVQDEVSHHFRRYTLGSLMEVFKKVAELKIIRKTYYVTLLFLPIAIVRLFSRWFNIKNRQSDFNITNPILDPIFYLISGLELQALKLIDYPFGVSILIILEKNENIKK